MTAIATRRDAGWLIRSAPELITRSAVAEVCGLDRPQIDRMIATAVLTTVPVGKRNLIPRTAVLRLLGLPVPGDTTP